MSDKQETRGSKPCLRRLPVGAEVLPEGDGHFRVWAPNRKKVGVILEQEKDSQPEWICRDLEYEENGYFSARVPQRLPAHCTGSAWMAGHKVIPTPPRDSSQKAHTALPR